jgi:hypothetical protein
MHPLWEISGLGRSVAFLLTQPGAGSYGATGLTNFDQSRLNRADCMLCALSDDEWLRIFNLK